MSRGGGIAAKRRTADSFHILDLKYVAMLLKFTARNSNVGGIALVAMKPRVCTFYVRDPNLEQSAGSTSRRIHMMKKKKQKRKSLHRGDR